MLYQRRQAYQALCRYERSNVSKYCTVSVLMNRLHAYAHLCQTLLPHTSYSCWLVSLTFEVTAPLARALLLTGAHEVRGAWSSDSNRRQENSYT
jgi:hypothetical protein